MKKLRKARGKAPDMVSQMGYASNSPFNQAPMNHIQGNGGITMQNTRRELLVFSQSGGMSPTGGGQTLQPGQDYQMAPNVTEMPVETLFEMEAQLVELHLKTLSKKDQMIFIERYQPLSDNMKKAALMQMFDKYQTEIVPPQDEQSMQSGGYFQKLDLSPKDTVSPQNTLYTAQRPLQQIDYGRSFTQFATQDLDAAAKYRRAGEHEVADQFINNVYAGEDMRKQLTGTFMRPSTMQAGGEVPKFQRVAPPTDGYVFQSITSNRPVPENTVDMAKVPQGTRRKAPVKSAQSPSTAAKPAQPVTQTETPQPMSYAPQAQNYNGYSFGADQQAQVFDSRGNSLLLPKSDTAKTVWSTAGTGVYTPAEPKEGLIHSPTRTQYQEDSRVKRIETDDPNNPRDYSAISDRFEVVGDTDTSHDYYVVQDTKTGDFYRRNKKTGLYTPHTGALPKKKK